MATDLSAIEADIAVVQAAASQDEAAGAMATAIKNAVESAAMTGTAEIGPDTGTCVITAIVADHAAIKADVVTVQNAVDQPTAKTAMATTIKNAVEAQAATGTTVVPNNPPGTCELTAIFTALAAIEANVGAVQNAADQPTAKTAMAVSIRNGILALAATGEVNGGAGTCEITSVL